MATVAHPKRDSWSLLQGENDAARAAHHASLFALANGSLGIRGGVDELGEAGASYLPDGYSNRPIAYHEKFHGFADSTDTRLSGPNINSLALFVNDRPIDFAREKMLFLQRKLDFRDGIVRRVARWDIAGLGKLDIMTRFCVPLGAGPVALARYTITPLDFTAHIAMELRTISPMATLSLGDAGDPRINAANERQQFCERTTGAGMMETAHVSLSATSPVTIAAVQRLATDHEIRIGNGAAQRIGAMLQPGEELRAERFIGFAVNQRADAASQGAQTEAARALEQGSEQLLAQHQAELDSFWRGAELEIDGDPELTRAIRFNLFHLFQSANRDDQHSIAAKGLTGEGYEGHVFWDTEAYMLPVLALTAPKLARHTLMYRWNALDKARKHARLLGHEKGALFPWRTIAGAECSAHYPTGSAQYHINAAIAYAMETYMVASGDQGFLLDAGAELLCETARIWLEIGHFSDRRDGAFVIHGVTGPDEYSALVDNDYYTNAMAQQHLRYASKVARQILWDHPQLAAKIDLTREEISRWEKAAEKMWLPVDQETGISPQDDAFLGKPHFDFQKLDPERFPLLLHYHPMVLYRHQLCKQGDVVQAMVMAGEGMPQSLKARNLAYYEPLTTHDSTLSAPAFAILAADVGEHDKALHYHREAAFVDIENRHGNTHHGVHLAAMAGSWLTLTQGWGGLRIVDGALHLRPQCPGQWKGYRFRLNWQGSLLEVSVDQAGVQYQLLQGSPVTLHDHGRCITVRHRAQSVPRPDIQAVIFDLDGVLTDTAEAHYRAWKQLCDEQGWAFDRKINEQLKGVSRAQSLRIILDHAEQSIGEDEFKALMARKNGYYRQLIAEYSPEQLFPGVRKLLANCQRAGLKIALASASRNAGTLVQKLGIEQMFDYIADAGAVKNAKPAPDIFLDCAKALGVSPGACIGVEDSAAGIDAINSAGMTAIGIGDAHYLNKAAKVLPDIAALDMESLLHMALNQADSADEPLAASMGGKAVRGG